MGDPCRVLKNEIFEELKERKFFLLMIQNPDQLYSLHQCIYR